MREFAVERRVLFGAMTVAVATVLALVVWGVLQLAGMELDVEQGGSIEQVNAVEVAVATLVGGLLAAGVYAWMYRRHITRWWPFVGSTALAVSMYGPGRFGESASDAMGLMVLHLVAGAVLIFGFMQTSPLLSHERREARRHQRERSREGDALL